RPQPDKRYRPDGKLHLVYQRSTPPPPISVWLAVTPTTAGNISLQAVVNERYSVTWQQFVYPSESRWKWSVEPQHSSGAW
ncbi:hypothetical protein Q6261_26800, partial [Klebsiella pneumoniae]|nr:hypothetical protein [Klebsiella pneumoniae]